MLPADIDWHFHTTSLVRFCVIVKTREIVINSLPVTSSIGHKMRQKETRFASFTSLILLITN